MGFLKRLRSDETGFTLMEVMLAMALFTILSVSIGTLLTNTINTNKRLTEKSMKLEDARVAMDFIQTHIKDADQVTIDSNHQLTVTDDGDSDTFRFNDSSNQIEYQGLVIAQQVDSFKVSKTADILKIEIQMEAGRGYEALKLLVEVNVKYKQ